MEVANTLAYYNTATITVGKSFIAPAPDWAICETKLYQDFERRAAASILYL